MAEKKVESGLPEVVQEISVDGLKRRLDVFSQVGKTIPETLKYYGVQYLDGDKAKNLSCFSREEAEAKVKTLLKGGRQAKLVEGIRASGVNLLSRYLGIEERLDLSESVNNLEQVCQQLAQGKPAVLYATEKRVVELGGKLFRGIGATGVFIQQTQGLDRLYHSAIAKAETRARARAEATALGLPIQVAEDLEAAPETEVAPEVVEVAAVEVEAPEQTSPEEREKQYKAIAKQIMPDEKGQIGVLRNLKAKLGITTSIQKVPEEVYRRFISELDKLEKMVEPSEEI